MSATHWLTLGIVSGLGALGGATSLKPTPVESGSAVMIDSLASRSYATTLEGVQAAHRTVLQNLANAQTPGYRAVRPMFEVWLDETARTSGAMLPTMETSTKQGWPIDTGRTLDVQIQGSGHLQVLAPNAPSGRAYTRVGHLTVDPQGFLATGRPGHTPRRLAPPIAIPDGPADLRVTDRGTVEALAPETKAWIPVGSLQLASFPHDQALQPAGDVLHATTAAGTPLVAEPGTPGLGTLRSGVLEGSNVDLAAETEQLRHLRVWSEWLSEALMVPDPLVTVATASR